MPKINCPVSYSRSLNQHRLLNLSGPDFLLAHADCCYANPGISKGSNTYLISTEDSTKQPKDIHRISSKIDHKRVQHTHICAHAQNTANLKYVHLSYPGVYSIKHKTDSTQISSKYTN